MKYILSCRFGISLAVYLILTLAVMGCAMKKVPVSLEEERRAKEAGFIALADTMMIWEDANAFCQRQGGKLPLVGNLDEWDGENPTWRGIPIEGFGYRGRPWDEVGLPTGVYWTGTKNIDGPPKWFISWTGKGSSWLIVRGADGVNVQGGGYEAGVARVACVP
jgi:hypothetical protein